MPDELKKFLSRELEELRQNKIRAGALVACVVFLLIYCVMDDSPRNEEISLNEPTAPTETASPVTKDLPAKPLPVTKNSDGVTLVMGANADALTVADPFAGEDKPTPAPPTKISAPVAPIGIKPPPIPKPQEIILTGTAISGERKTAMFLRGKETIFLSIGEQLDGRQIVDITADFVTFADGSRIYVQN